MAVKLNYVEVLKVKSFQNFYFLYLHKKEPITKQWDHFIFLWGILVMHKF